MRIQLTPTDDFDLALASNRQPGTEFVLTKGTYKTKGNWYYSDWFTLAAGCKLYGEGSTLILSENPAKSYNGVVRPDRDLNVLWSGANTYIENLTVDGNESAFVNTDPSKTWFVVTGVRAHGKATIKNVTVQNIRGTRNGIGTITKQIEAFGFSTVGPVGGSIIDGCTVQSCPENSYISCISAGHTGTNLSQSIISNCNTNVSKNNWFGFGVNCCVYITNSNVINGSMIGVYNDTDNSDNVTVENCSFNNIEKLISLITIPGKNEYKRNLKIKNVTATYTSGSTKHLVEMWDQGTDSTKRQMGPILLQNVKVTQDVSSSLYVACVGNDIRPVTLVDCSIPYGVTNLAGNMLSIY